MHATTVGAAIALALLWFAEALFPFFVGRRARGAHGTRNLTLGIIGGAVRATFFPAGLVLVTAALDALGLGVLRLVPLPAWAQAVLAVLLLDLATYAWHVASHHWRFLWRFHAVHHHDDSVDSTTAFRFHAGDVLATALVTLCVVGALGLRVEHVLLYEALLIPLSIFHHGNIRLPARVDRALRWVIVTPSLHWVHHSRWVAETDSNYAGIFSFWDYLFGTLRVHEDPASLRVGLDGYAERDHSTLAGCLLTPFGPIKSRAGSDSRADSTSGLADSQTDPGRLGASASAAGAGKSGSARSIPWGRTGIDAATEH